MRLPARMIASLAFILGACISACAPTMKYNSLPCPDSPPDMRADAGLTEPRLRSFLLTSAASRWDAYLLIEPSGSVNPDSIMVCGVSDVTTRDKVARQIAGGTFAPATLDGRPVRRWFHMTFGDRPRPGG